MKRVFVLLGCAILLSPSLWGQKNDSLRIVNLNDVVISAYRTKRTTPMAVSQIGRKEIVQNNLGRDLPYILMNTPSVVVTSDNGLGIGTTYFRVRGADNSRVNFTYDGVPMNDSEDQSVFWANMNSFAASLDNIQIQRGVGTSTNGSGAFGATVLMKSATPQLTPYVMTNASYGSYNTYKYDIMGGSGLLNNHFVFDARYSQTYTDGYIDRTSGHLGTYAFSASYYGKSFFIRYRNFGSYEHVGQAWNGITPDEMEKYGRKYNSLGKYVDEDGVSHYVPTTDNYWQNHNHLTFVKYINDKWKTNVTLHYTHGSGYYNDLKDSAKFYKFGLDNFTNSLGQKVKKGALMRRKSLQNDFYGGIYNLYYTDERKSFVFGASANHFDGDHWGEVKWAYNYPHLNYNNHYYDSNAKKSDYSFFVKGDYRIISVLSVFCDLQYRGVDYKITGQNDKFYTDADWNNIQQTLNVDKHWDFFNPKAGINFENNGHRAYASIAQAHREPTRNNYTDNGQFDPAPKAESLTDLEVGYSLQKKIFNVGVNFYYMHYKDQLILNGNTSDIGEALTINVPKSYRMGVELSANLNPCKWFDWSANMTISKNKIKNFKESLMTYDADWNELAPTVTEYGNSDIAFSPRVIANNRFNFNVKDFTVAVLTNYVSRQYLDNTQTKSRSLKVYSTTDLKLGYSIHPKFIKELGLGLDVYNLFNSKYENNGGCGGDVFDGTKEYWTWLFPQVGTTFMASVRMKF